MTSSGVAVRALLASVASVASVASMTFMTAVPWPLSVPPPTPTPAVATPAPLPTVKGYGSTFTAGTTTLMGPAAGSAGGTPRYEYERVPVGFCTDVTDSLSPPYPCVGFHATYVTPICADGSDGDHPLFVRRLDAPDGALDADWQQVDEGGCPGDSGLVEVTAEEFRRLPVAPSTPYFQPANGRGLVNMDLIVYTDPAPQLLSTTVLGVPLTVRATPAQFSWEFGDGSAPLVTADPGAPYPDYTVAHPFRQPGSYEVQLTTTWRGEYQVDGEGPWYPVTGTVTTTSAPFSETVVEARSHLVDEDLSG